MSECRTVSRPILRYHGGKFVLAPWLISHFPPHRVYVEPYGGAASVLLRKPRSYAEVYNDLDSEVVNLFRVARDNGEELRRVLSLTPFAREEYQSSFMLAECPVEQARRTVVRSFMGFGSNALCRDVKSGFRSNSNRSGTTPAHDWKNFAGTGFRSYTGEYDGRRGRSRVGVAWETIPDALGAIIDRLRGVVIENKDALEVMRTHDGPETLHYVDPPYVHTTRSLAMHGNHGYTHEMSDDDHTTLAAFLKTLTGAVVLSGYDCDLYRDLYAGWERSERESLADGARKRTEVVWTRNVRADQERLALA